MQTTAAQVRKLMEEMSKHGKVGVASMRSGLDRKTGRKYARSGKYPAEPNPARTWRTREDPFTKDWAEIALRLEDAPELEAKTLFEDLIARKPLDYEPGQIRTFQRHVRIWRAQHGPPKRVFFAQNHRPGEAMQTDFTDGSELLVTIAGEQFSHLLCHAVLPYSNWEWATVARSESLVALRRGVQATLFQLGRVPEWNQTDNSTAATHRLDTGKRTFNDDYRAVMEHFGLKPRTTAVGEKEQNGDVEALNGVFKRRLVQHLLLRGNRDFESVEIYERWMQGVLEKANVLRTKKLADEMAVMRPLVASRLAEYVEESPTVTSWSTIRVKRNTYSVPSRLIDERVRARIFEDRIEIYFGDILQERIDRLSGEDGRVINYRHVIWSLVRKPGAFARYRYREELFPSITFRRAYDALREGRSEREADIGYVRILHLAASTMESEVEAALVLMAESGHVPEYEAVKALVAPTKGATGVPAMAELEVDLRDYDGLLACDAEAVAS